MRSCEICVDGEAAAVFTEETRKKRYALKYFSTYRGRAISLTLPVRNEPYFFAAFPAFFDGLLPEGLQLEHALQTHKIDRDDGFGLLLRLGGDMVGHVTVRSAE